MQYRRAGATRRLLIGSAEVLGADRARAAAKEVLAKVALGEDPQADKIARRAQDEHTLRAVAADYLAGPRSVVRPNTYRELERYLTGPHFKPLHGMAIDQITRRDVAAAHRQDHHGNGSPSAAKARATLSAMYAWALGHGLCEINPVVGTIAPENAQPRERVLTDSELVALWRVCGDDDLGRLVKLLLLTAQRRSEVGGMRWSELDLDARTWTLPAARSEEPSRAHAAAAAHGARHHRDRAAHGRARSAVRRARRAWLYAVEAKRDLDARLGEAVARGRCTICAGPAATRMADIGVQPHIIEQALNHISGHKGGVAGIYNRSSYEREVRAHWRCGRTMCARWSRAAKRRCWLSVPRRKNPHRRMPVNLMA